MVVGRPGDADDSGAANRLECQSIFGQAVASHRAGDLETAKRLYRDILARLPDFTPAAGNLAALLRAQGNPDAALAVLSDTVRIAPDEARANPDFMYNLGNAYGQAGRFTEAVQAYDQVVALVPDHSRALHNRALALENLGWVAEAKASCERSLAADPDYADAKLTLAGLCHDLGELDTASQLYEQLLRQNPERPELWSNYGSLLQESLRSQEAREAFRRAVTLEPGNARIISNYIWSLQYAPAAEESELTKIAVDLGACFGQERQLSRPAVGTRALRVGFVSPDLNSHPVGFFLKGVVHRFPMATIAYFTGSHADSVTEQLKQAMIWREAAAWNVEEFLARVREDEIDILVDLSGHSAGNRLPLFARRAAPVQVSWLGYFATTGIPAMDYVVMDHWHAPPGSEALFSETVLRLPKTRLLYDPVAVAPAVSDPPSAWRPFVTFGSFNNTAKYHPHLIACWSRILHEVPGSRLILKWRTLSSELVRARLVALFAANGIGGERIELRPASPHRELLQAYADVDIALDPFPFSGGHTSCESLWMGVPLVTLPGPRPVSRQGLCLLANLGMQELVALDEADYIARAVALALDRSGLVTRRARLREAMARSPLMDAAGFAADFHDLLRSVSAR